MLPGRGHDRYMRIKTGRAGAKRSEIGTNRRICMVLMIKSMVLKIYCIVQNH